MAEHAELPRQGPNGRETGVPLEGQRIGYEGSSRGRARKETQIEHQLVSPGGRRGGSACRKPTSRALGSPGREASMSRFPIYVKAYK